MTCLSAVEFLFLNNQYGSFIGRIVVNRPKKEFYYERQRFKTNNK